MRRLKGLILLCLLWACFIMHSGAQNTLAPSYIDSIQKIIDTAEHDSTLVNAYVDWGMSEMSKETDCILLFNKADSICLQNLKMVEPKLDGEERIYFEHKRIKIAVASGLYYRRQNLFEEAIAYLLKAEKIYKDKDDLGLAEVLKDLGALHYFLGRFQEAKKYTSGGLDVYSKNNNKKGMVACYGNLGNINTDEGDIDSGLEFYEKGLALAEEINYAAAIAQILGNIGVIYSSQGEYAKAIAIYEKGIKILEGKNEPQRIIRILGNLGVVHSTQGNYSKSIQAYMESLRMSEKLGDKDFISWNLNSISWIYFEQKEYDKALEYAQKSLDILLGTNLKNETAHAYYSLGSIYAEKGENNQALEFYNKSLNIAEEVNDQLLIANVLSNLGMHYYENEKDYSKAENYIIKSIEIYTQVNDQNKLFHNKSILADIYLGQGNIKKSISYQKEVLAEGEKMEVINLIKDASEGLYVAGFVA